MTLTRIDCGAVRRFATLAAAMTFGLASASPPGSPRNPAMATGDGVVVGRPAERPGVEAFKGIPYAAAPIGALRWRSPMPAPAWSKPRDASRFGPACPQNPAKSDPIEAMPLDPVQSEDCLFLNIWRPTNAGAGRKLPVLVWIHGGAFQVGAASFPMYDGSALAAKGVVVVTINYRIGLLGYLAHPALAAESAQNTSGNYALQDQIAALRWVHRNIARFGGDPAEVTIAGHSGGGISVGTLMLAPQARTLFARAIIQSGPLEGLAPQTKSRADAERIGSAWMARRGATTAAELRALPVSSLLKRLPQESGASPLGPIVDGIYIPRSPAEMIVAGSEARVPLMIGLTTGESGSMTAGRPTPASVTAFIIANYGAGAAIALDHYPRATGAEAENSQSLVKTDQMLAASRAQAACHARAGNPTWLYQWDHAPPGPDSDWQRAYHGSELAYIFGTLGTRPRPWTAADHALTERIQDRWVNFIKRGNPNGPRLENWPTFEATTWPHRIAAPEDPVTPSTPTAWLERIFPSLDPHPDVVGTPAIGMGCTGT